MLPGFVSTGIGMRMMVPFCLMLFPLLSSIFVDSIDICLSQKEIGIKLVTLTTVGYLVVFSAYNYQSILRGYAVNTQIRLHNAMLLEEAAHTGEKEIHLKRLTDDTYANIQPYQSGYEYIEKYIREYYDLLKDAVFLGIREQRYPILKRPFLCILLKPLADLGQQTAFGCHNSISHISGKLHIRGRKTS